MLRAANRIEHGVLGKDGKNALVVIDAHQPVKGLATNVVEALVDAEAIYDDGRDADSVKDDKG